MNPIKFQTVRHLQSLALAALAFAGMLSSVQAQVSVSEAVPNIPSAYTNYVTSYGALSDGITTNTSAINAAILDAASTNGGGTVIIPFVVGTSNIYICGQINLKNKTRLQVQAGVIVRMLPKAQWSGNGLITASSGASDLEISGTGTLDGNTSLAPGDWWMTGGSRPKIITIAGAARVLIKDITMINSPNQHIVIGSSATTNVTIKNITIATDSNNSYNTDGIDLVGKYCLIKDCKISDGDDNIAIGSTSHEVVVTNCFFGTGHGMSFGSSTGPGGITNVLVTDCAFTNTDNGIRIKSDATSGGPVFNCYFYNLHMTNVNNNAMVIYGYYPANIANSPSNAAASSAVGTGSSEPMWHDLYFSNINATVSGTGYAGVLWGRTEYPMTNIVISHVNITAAKSFCVFNCYGARFLDSTILTTNNTFKTITMWNAGVILSNTVSGGGPLTFDGCTTNFGDDDLAIFNSQAAFTYSNLFSEIPLTLGGGTLTVSNNLFLTNGSVVNFTLGPNPTLVNVSSNLNLNSTINIAAGIPMTNGTYTLFTYGTGTLQGAPVLGTIPPGTTCNLDTSTPGQVNLVVSGYNNPPVASAVTTYRHSGQPARVTLSTLSAGWTDFEGNTPVTFSSVNSPSLNGATVVYDGVSAINYTNVNNVNDQFSYVIADSLGATSLGVVNVIVTNQPPTAAPVTIYRHFGQPASVTLSTLSAGWSDPEGDSVSFASLNGASTNGGSVLYDGISTITYTSGNNVTDQFSYFIADAYGAMGTGLVNVLPTNLPPVVASTPSYATYTGTPLQIHVSDLATNWSDPDSDPVTLVSVTSPSTTGGTVVYDGVANINYTNNNLGADHFNYIITDSFGATASGQVNVSVTAPPLSIVSLSPANGATNICTDTPLRITFNVAPNYGTIAFTNAEQITIFAQGGAPVDVISMVNNASTNTSINYQSRFIGATNGSTFSYHAFPIIVSGNTATIFPHNTAFTNNETYYINITSHLFTNSVNGAFTGINDATTWSFKTKPSKPPTGTNVIEVAADGTGDFCTVQGALDFLPAANSSHVLFNIHKGIYQEIVFNNAKNNITFRGNDRKQTMIAYPDNDNLNSGATKRSMFYVSGDDIAIENLTLTNSTPHGGSQAEALRMGGRRFIANYCDIDSYQDTVLVNSSSRYAYFYNCHIQGDVDFIWNDACAVFQSCEIESLTSSGFNAQMRTPDASHYGAIMLDCSLTKASGVTGTVLNRIDPNVYPFCAIAYINCNMDTHITPVGWELDNENTSSPTNGLRLWEYQSKDITGTTLIDVSHRAGCSMQLSAAQASALRNLTNVYGINMQWLPQLLPNIITQPTNQMANPGDNVSFITAATGIQTTNPITDGNPSIIVPLSYQWLKNGTNVVGATNATLSLLNVQHADGGTYTLVASNLAGVTLSTNVTLIVSGDQPPNAANATVYRHNGQPLHLATSTLAPYWSDPDSDPVSLASVFSPSTNGAPVVYDGVSTINYTNANNVSDQFSYVVSDGLGGTNYGLVTVLVTNQPPVASPVTYTRNSGLPLQILVANLATNWSDPEADATSFGSVLSPSTNTGVAVYDGVSAINYTNVHSVPDQLTYSLSDSFGATNVGVINILVLQNPPASIASTLATRDGNLTVNFAGGTPSVAYWVLASTNVTTPLTNWVFVSTNVAAGDGTWQFIDTQRTNYQQRYYRSVEAY